MRTPKEDRGRDAWTAYHELLSQLIEVTSVPAANMRLKKPVKVPRPKRKRRRGQRIEAVPHVPSGQYDMGTSDAPPQQQVYEVPAGGNAYSAAMNMLGAIPPPSRKLTVLQGGGQGEETA